MARRQPLGIQALAASGIPLSFTTLQCVVWTLTFLSYTLYHASRKPLSIVKGVLHPEAPTSNMTTPSHGGWAPFNGPAGRTLLGELDLAFLLSYSFGMYFSGQLADRLDLRSFLAVGMLGSGFFACLFGMGFFWKSHSLLFFLLANMMTGLFQSTGWPSVVAAMANWHGKEGRGLVLGVWNAHTSLGNILGSLSSSAVLFLGWGWAFIVPGISIALGGVLVFLLMPGEPEDVGFESPRHKELEEAAEKAAEGGRREDAENSAFGAEKQKNAVAPAACAKCAKDQQLKEDQGSNNTAHPCGSMPDDVEACACIPNTIQAETAIAAQVETKVCLKGDSSRPSSPEKCVKAPDTSAELTVPLLSLEEKERSHAAFSAEECTGAVGFIDAWRIPGVAAYAFCLFFAKLVAYTFLDWLPFYISHTKIDGVYVSDSLAGVTSVVYDLGGILGGILAGHLSDRLGAQAVVSAGFMMCAVPALGLYYSFGHLSLRINITLLAIVGFCVNGPYALITCAVSADLGQHKSLKGNSRALSTVTGIIDGTGSLGAALGPFFTGIVADFLGGWAGVFGMLMSSAALSVLCIARLAHGELTTLFSS